MQKIKAIIVEDILNHSKELNNRINSLFPQVEVLAVCDTLAKAKSAIETGQPNLLFLDIDIGTDNGFDLLKQLTYKSFKLIFTTSHTDMAKNAMRVSAIDYLEKPYDDQELIDAVNRAIDMLKKERMNDIADDMEIFINNIKQTNNQSQTIVLTNFDGDHHVKLTEIIFCSTIKISTDSGSQSRIIFRLTNRPGIILSNKTIEHYDEILRHNAFFKVSASAIVNLHHILTFKRKSSDLIMRGYHNDQGKMEQAEIGISDKFKESFAVAFNKFGKSL